MDMTLLLEIAAVGLGAIVGSFLNALLYRFNTGRSIAKGRSRCMNCAHELGARDLVPIFSYLLLGGRCRYCGTKISVQYPLVEAAAAVLSLFIYLEHPTILGYAFWFVVWMILLFIVVYDLRHTVIPWSASILLALLALLSLFVSLDTMPVILFTPNLWSLAAGPLLALPLFLLSLVSRGRWMGWGDAPLELSLGWLLGLSLGGTAMMLAFWIGAGVGIVLIIFKKGLTMKSELPFAPFLVLGALISHFFHVDFFSSLPFLW
jgi:leader peptidase (prepilin peptidase)/N-methyltransferase